MAVPDLTSFDEIYIDESSQTAHRYLLIGGIIIHAEQASAFEEAMRQARLPELPQGEMGWTKVSRTKVAAYGRVVDLFFNNPDKFAPFEFHALAIDTHRLKDRVFNEGSRSIGFNKEIFQLCMKFGRLHGKRLLHVYPDFRQTDQPPEELRLILNRSINKKGDTRDWPYRRVHFRDSSTLQIMQLVDVLLGGLAFRLNGHFAAAGASHAKTSLSAHILKRARITDVTKDTAVTGKFTLWHRNLK